VELPSSSSKLSITSLALAIAAVTVFWPVMAAAVIDVRAAVGVVVAVTALAGVVLGVGAVVTGLVARRRVKRGNAGRGGVALAGIVLGVVAVVLPAIILAEMVYQIYSDYQEFQECVKGSGSAYPNYLCLKECPQFFGSWCREEIGW
jgi:MFS family permease